ncbi:hypothetical protein CYMTET_29830 [Cymbomonas tetramitiformis]|uniref:Uncharacterized protein n=1 Tax=Cymbomonas tetramitiformis TaxID=36881 RepID=A0AAE0KUS5_9CHLO|nr:hypothetical protein CYMTET_29830 [Cymbomonas tetramitiformis]
MICMTFNINTWSLLGVTQILGYNAKIQVGMDAITWMGMTVWEIGGPTAFVLFTGLSILPSELTLGDCIIRGVAAFYLRMRSRSFRQWVEKIESAHILTWGLRGILLVAALRMVPAETGIVIVLGGVALTAILHWAEKFFN